jgi:hypothetical protein
MKKGVVIAIFIFILLLNLNFVVSAELTDSEKVENAYACLRTTIDNKGCSSLSIEEQIFSLLTVGKCKNQLSNEMNKIGEDFECWPTTKGSSSCDIKTTAQAIYALDKAGVDTTKAEDWLLSQKQIPQDLNWFLEIDSTNTTSCTISNASSATPSKIADVMINEDKTINSVSSNPCFQTSQNGYWLEINSNCYGDEFLISCDQDFLTTLLFKKQDSNTYHILDRSQSASSDGTTIEQIKSFSIGSNYLGSLWATTILGYLGYEMDSYIPYLITSYEKGVFFSEPLLYILTGFLEYRTEILNSQINSQYWWSYTEDSNKFYDTALALFPFSQESLGEKDNSIKWLFEVQDKSGCWNNDNIRDTAFLLHSIWGSDSGTNGDNGGGDDGDSPPDNSQSCLDEGYYCVDTISDCSGDILTNYSCEGIVVCCDTEPAPQTTCFGEGGEICNSNQYCSQGNEQFTPDLTYGETCCIGGTCELKNNSNGGGNGGGNNLASCESKGGECKFSSCDEGYKETDLYSCEYSTDICCIEDNSSSGGSYWWLWVLGVLIILLVLAIVFKDKIKEIILKIQTKRGGKPSGNNVRRGPPGIPPRYQRAPLRPLVQRKVLPPQRKPLLRKSVKTPPKELDEVLRKLKDMSK